MWYQNFTHFELVPVPGKSSLWSQAFSPSALGADVSIKMYFPVIKKISVVVSAGQKMAAQHRVKRSPYFHQSGVK